MGTSESQCDPVSPGVRAPEHGSVLGELDTLSASRLIGERRQQSELVTACCQVFQHRLREPVLQQQGTIRVEPETGCLDRLLHVHAGVDEVMDHLRRRVKDSVTAGGADRQTDGRGLAGNVEQLDGSDAEINLPATCNQVGLPTAGSISNHMDMLFRNTPVPSGATDDPYAPPSVCVIVTPLPSASAVAK